MSWLRIVIGIVGVDVDGPVDVDLAADLPVTSRFVIERAGGHAQRERQRQDVAVLGAPRALAHEEAIPDVAF